MHMKKETAKKLIERLEEVNHSIFSILSEFEDQLSPEDYKGLQREMARMGGISDI